MRFNIAALKEQGMSNDEINAYIAKAESRMLSGASGPRGSGRPGGLKGSGLLERLKGGDKSTPGYDIMAPMPDRRPDIGTTGYDVMAPMPDRPELTSFGGTRSNGFPGAGVGEAPDSNETEKDTPRRSKKKEKFQKLLEKKKARRKANRMERKQDRREVRIKAKRGRLADKPRRLAKFEEMLQALQGS